MAGRSRGPVLVVGGTGMLAGLVTELVRRGDEVLVPSRHPTTATDGRISLAADWTEPDAFAAAVAEHVDQPLSTVVVWCHRPHRQAITAAIRPMLAPEVTLLQVLGSTTLMHLWDERPAADVIHVMLGHHQRADGTARWLTHAEISDGVLGALDRTPGSTVVVGSLD